MQYILNRIQKKGSFSQLPISHRNSENFAIKRQGYTLYAGWYRPSVNKTTPFWTYGVALRKKE